MEGFVWLRRSNNGRLIAAGIRGFGLELLTLVHRLGRKVLASVLYLTYSSLQ